MKVAECSPTGRRTNPRVDRTRVSGHLKSMASEHLKESKRSLILFHTLFLHFLWEPYHSQILKNEEEVKGDRRQLCKTVCKKKKKKVYQVLVRLSFPGGTSGKDPACQYKRHKKPTFDPLGLEDPLEKGTATHSSILAWRIPWTGSLAGYST